MAGRHSKAHDEDYRINNKSYNKSSKRKNGERKKSGQSDLIFILFAVIYILATILFYISVVRMGLLPDLYITIFSVAELIFTLAIAVGLAKRHKTYKLNVFCLIIALLISGVYIWVMNYTNATTKFIDTIFTEMEETEDYYIVVRKNGEYSKIEDLKNKDIYLFQVEEDIKTQIGSKVNITLRVSKSLNEIGNNLLNKKIDAILVSSVQYDMLSEEIEKFKDDSKIIYTANHKIAKTEEVKSDNSEYTLKNGVFNVYISGIDTSGKISNVSRSDANIIATINMKTHEVLLTSIPRDYYVTLHSKKAKDKLTHSGNYGISETVTTVEDLMDIDINYYVRVNFTTVIKLVDTLGGIDVHSDYAFSRGGYSFKKGTNHLNGDAALVFSRERKLFAGGDNQRVKNQQYVIQAIIKKAQSSAILTKYTSILKTLEGCFQTNVNQSEISSLVKMQLKDMPSWKVKTNSLSGTGAYKTTYSMGNVKLYVMIPNETSVEQAKKQIKEVMDK